MYTVENFEYDESISNRIHIGKPKGINIIFNLLADNVRICRKLLKTNFFIEFQAVLQKFYLTILSQTN